MTPQEVSLLGKNLPKAKQNALSVLSILQNARLQPRNIRLVGEDCLSYLFISGPKQLTIDCYEVPDDETDDSIVVGYSDDKGPHPEVWSVPVPTSDAMERTIQVIRERFP